MKSFLIVFLALLWACFAATDTAPPPGRNLRRARRWEARYGRDMSTREERDRSDRIDDHKMKPICVNTHGYRGGNGHMTFWVPEFKFRWFKKWNDVTDGECKREDAARNRSDGDLHPYCRYWEGKNMWCTIWAPEGLESWLLAHDADPGRCTQKNQGDVIDVEYERTTSSGGGDDYDDRFCVYEVDEGEYHTVDVIYPDRDDTDHSITFWRNWFEDAVDEDNGYDGRCDAQDEDNTPTHRDRYYCVEVDDEWCTFDTDLYWRDWLKFFADSFRNGHCNDYNNLFDDYEGCEFSMKFYHD